MAADSIDDLVQRALGGERRALGRLLTYAERGGAAAEAIADLIHGKGDTAHIVGITGAPGAGKSTLVGQLVEAMARAGKRPAVLAVDPSSPLSGGAILGDRIRMDGVVNPDVFIRSMATRGHQGGLALAVPSAVRLLAATGHDPVVIETVGVGQVEVDVASAADTTVVVVTPGLGDAVQANKAGLLEVADLFVVNKADLPGASDARRDLELMLDLSHVSGHRQDRERPEIIMTTATEGDGAEKLWLDIDGHRAALEASGEMEGRRRSRTRGEVRDRLRQLLHDAAEDLLDSAAGSALVDEAANGNQSTPATARALFDTFQR